MINILFSLSNRNDLANSIIFETNTISKNNLTERGDVRVQKFSDGELCVDFISSVRGKRVYLLGNFNNSDEVMVMMLAIDAAKRAAASEIIPILPYFIYARSDKKDQSRGPIGAKMMAEMIEQRGATSVITFDLHADQIQGFFNIPVTHIEGKNVFDDYIKSISNENMILAGPDVGSGKRVKRMQKQLAKKHDLLLNYVMLDKTRTEANKVDEMVIIGDVKGKNVIILDDMVDTAGTLCKAAEVLIEAGANSVRAVISHGVLSGRAIGRIGNSLLKSLIISDSLPLHKVIPPASKDEEGLNRITVVSVAHQIGFAMAAINNQMSYEALKEQYHASV